MKKLADYQGDEAIELWADLLEPAARILADKNIEQAYRAGKPPVIIAKEVLKTHAKDANEILLRIDPTPVDGLNIITRLVNVVLEIMNNSDMKDFFVSAGQAKMESESTGSATANIKVVEA